MQLLFSVLLFVSNAVFLPGFESNHTLEFRSDSAESQIFSEITDSQLNPLLFEDFQIEFLLIEKEEKNEFEYLPLQFFAETAIFSISKKDYTDWQTSFFSTKAKKDGIDLYDLFDCWKSEFI
jgi:hypothetical protein